jgi:sulfur-oxidizing protein SoxZ
MDDATKIRAVLSNGVTEVRIRMAHPMETGQRKEGSKTVAAHYIIEVTAQHNGKTVLSASFSQAVSRDPFVHFKFKGGAKGDKLVISWVDSQGAKRTDEGTIT